MANVSACSNSVSDFSSTNKRQTRPRKRYTPSTPLVFHGFAVLQRAHEHLVKPERIRAVFHQHVVGIHHVAARLGHLLSVLAENQALIDELEKRFRRGDVAEIEQNLVPEPRVKQMQHGVFRAADV